MKENPTQKGWLIGIVGIFLGLLTAFGGVDLPALLIFGIWAIIAISQSREWGVIFSALKRSIIPLLLTIICFGYFTYTRIIVGQEINETIKSFIAALIGIPIFIWAFTGKNYDKTIMRRAAIAGYLLALFLLCFESLSGYAMYKIANPEIDPKELERNLGRGAFILVALFWPILGVMDALKLGTKAKTFTALGTIFIATRFGIDLNIAIILLCSVCASLALFTPRFVLGSIIAIFAFLMGFAPLVYGYAANFAKNNWPGTMPLSYERRADMWLYTIERIKEKPIYGWGLDSAKNFQDVVELGGYKWAAIQTHPHSAPLNIWLEGGAIGAVLFLLATMMGSIFLFSAIAKNKASAAPLSGGLSACLIAWALTYGAWQQWLWFLVLFVLCYSFFGSDPNKLLRKKLKDENDTSDFVEL